MFTHLHVHSEYSLLDGMCKIRPMVERAKELGMDALGLTDHGAMHGVIQFYLACRELGINPIVGVEGYMAQADHRGRTAAERNPYHIVLLAKSAVGYRNLIQLTTKAHLDGFYYKPRMDHALLETHHEGLIVLSGCPNAEVPRLIVEGRVDEATVTAQWYKELFGEDYYFELQDHAVPDLNVINPQLITMSKELGVPLVATNDTHYIRQEDSYAHDLLLCIQTNSNVHDEKRMKFSDDSFYLKSQEEMESLFQDYPEAIANTQRIAEKCHLELDLSSMHLPEYPSPDGLSADEYLAKLCREGLRKRFDRVTPDLERRLEYELDVIRQTRFSNYFLVVWDFVCFTKEQGILYGVRGSAAASLALYCLGITAVNPLEYNLVFERFLNLERHEMPDIDMDFADDRRDEVIAYVARKYGHDRVAQIITFGTLGAKAAIRDVGRALGMPYGDVDRVARLVPTALHMTIDRAMEESSELAQLYRQDDAVRMLADNARQLEGIARHASTHAAGVVISKDPLTDLVPLQRPSSQSRGAEAGDRQMAYTTQFAMDEIATIGLLKMDFLGLVNITVLGKARDLIARTRGIEIDLLGIPLDDKATFDLLSSGETTGVFQLESAGMRRYVQELKPNSLNDVSAMVALYRPGPMQHIPTFIRAKHGLEPVRFPHAALESILQDTYGVIVYQDQVLLIAQAFAGYSLGQADVMRKAMGKKITEIMRAEREGFVSGAISKGFSPKVAEEVFDLIEPFAGYAFNRAHAVSYALIAYQTAYLKAHFTEEYMASLLTCFMDTPDKIAASVAECQRMGVPVLPPDVNRSSLDFTVEKQEDGVKAIRFGLTAIKNVGSSGVEPIIRARESEGEFGNLQDFCRRVDMKSLNRRALESMIKVGALDRLGSRGALLASVERILAAAQREQKLKESGQATMFDLWGESVPVPMPAFELPDGDVPAKEKLTWEKELLGVYLSQHPFAAVAQRAVQGTTALCGQVNEELVGQTVIVAGMVSSARQLVTKSQRSFMSAVLEDLVGSLEVTVWPEVYEKTREIWTAGQIVLVRGKVTVRDGNVQLVCDSAQAYQEVEETDQEYPSDEVTSAPGARYAEAQSRQLTSQERTDISSNYKTAVNALVISIQETDDMGSDLARLREVESALSRHPGVAPVVLEVTDRDGVTHRLAFENMAVRCESTLIQELSVLVGSDNLRLVDTNGHELTKDLKASKAGIG